MLSTSAMPEVRTEPPLLSPAKHGDLSVQGSVYHHALTVRALALQQMLCGQGFSQHRDQTWL